MKAKKKHMVRRGGMCVVPIIVAIVLTVILRKHLHLFDEAFFYEIVKVVIDLEGTMLGFIITAVSILVAFNGSNLTEEVKQTGHFKTVLLVYLITCFELFVSIVFSTSILMISLYCDLIINIFITLLIVSAIYIIMCLFFLSLVVYTLFN